MSEFQVVQTRADLESLDGEEMVAGYIAGTRGDAEPGSAFSRSYWHGWRNGASDFGHRDTDEAQYQLARELYPRRAGMH